MLNDQLADANLRLRAYAIEAERTAETRERNRLAREIHDTLGHALTGIAAGLDACIVMVDTAPDFTKQQLVKIRETALRGIKDVRRSVKKLRPDDLEQMPLRDALVHMTQEFCASTGMDVRLNILKMPAHLREDEEEVVYRVVQEGITNANRHGHAQHQTVTITVEQGRIYLLLYDDGEGAPVDADGRVEEGFGLKHMKERVGLLHGTVRYESGQAFGGHGFSLEVVIPEPVQDSDIISFNATEAFPSNDGGSSEFNAYTQNINIDLVFRSSIAETYDIILECETESGRVLERRIVPPTINSRQNYYLYAAFSSYYGIEAYGAAYGLSFQDDDFKEGDTIHLTGSVSIHLYQGDRVKSVWPVIGTGSKELYKHIRSIYARRSNDFKDWGVTSPVTTYTNIDNGYGYFLARSRSEFKSRRVML